MRQQQVYFNHVVTGCPELRTFDIQNVGEMPLLFEIGAETLEIQVQRVVAECVGLQNKEAPTDPII